MVAAINASVASTSSTGHRTIPEVPTNLKIRRSKYDRPFRDAQTNGYGTPHGSNPYRTQRNGEPSTTPLVRQEEAQDYDDAEYDEEAAYDDEWYDYEEQANEDGFQEEENYHQEEELELPTPSTKKRRKEKDDESGRGVPILPVANLPDDWDGEVLDGPTYLALAA